MKDFICTTCGKPFQRYPSKMKLSKTAFCSKACCDNRTGGQQDVPCEVCGVAIRKKQHLLKSRMHHFCSRRCNGLWRAEHFEGARNPHYEGGKVPFPCTQCGITIFLFPALTKGRKFCSRRCHVAWQTEHSSGANNFHWRGGYREYYGPNWHQQRDAARLRDGHICQACGRSERKLRRRLDVHHITPFRVFGYQAGTNDAYILANDLMNLISLCPVCHKRAEHGYIPLQPKLI